MEKELGPLEKKPFNEILEGDRIKLVIPTEAHMHAFWETIKIDQKSPNSAWAWVHDLIALKQFFDKIQTHESFYLISFQDQILGSFNIHSKNYLDHKTEIGYAIAKAYEGKGYVSEAIQIAEKELKRLLFNKIIIICDQTNLRSIRVAERNGYIKEGMMAQDYIENGKFVDSVVFGKIIS